VRPALNVGISVSRVGSNAQTPGMKQVAGQLKLDLAQFRELAAFAQFGSDLDKATRERIDRGMRMQEILKQRQYEPMPVEHEILIIYAANKGYLDQVPVDKVREWEDQFHRYMDANYGPLVRSIYDETVVNRKKISDQTFAQVDAAIQQYQKVAPR
jgi:F-type H+-transporting ATPase subunit alpha